jgi:hypothetical protein
MKKIIPFILFAVLLFPSCRQGAKYSEKWIEDTLSQMTIDEKVAMVHAQSKFSSPGVPRLGIPEIWCTDGPHGIRPEVLWDEWTADYIQTYVDGQKLFYFPNDKKNNKDTWPFKTDFYLTLNLAWGGDWGGQKGVDPSALPATMQIDYVRVFQK